MTDKYKRYLQFKIKEIYLLIGTCLEELAMYNFALNIYEKAEAISRTDECYERIISLTKAMEKKFRYMNQYAEFNLNCGRYEQAIKVYQEIFDTFYYIIAMIFVRNVHATNFFH